MKKSLREKVEEERKLVTIKSAQSEKIVCAENNVKNCQFSSQQYKAFLI